MSEAWIGLLGSVIVAIISLFGVIYNGKVNRQETVKQMQLELKAHSDSQDAKLEKAQAITDTKLEILTAEVRKHNGFAEKIPVLEEKIKVANKRIDDLEHNKAR